MRVSQHFLLTMIFCLLLIPAFLFSQQVSISDETAECLDCHADLHLGLVASWQKSLHSKITPAEASKKDELSKRISTTNIDSSLTQTIVGCYECHSLNTDKHNDSFEHNGYTINVIVSSADCAECHQTEYSEYQENLMAYAHTNLVDNSVYMSLAATVNNPHIFSDGKLSIGKEDSLTNFESCLYCHGTKIKVEGTETRDTDLGEMEFPKLSGWPNQGVGRINPDGSKGSCTSCHPRHDFSIATARKPYTCAECHKGPDVPAYKVYEASKHGNIFKSKSNEMNFDNVPWVVGTDFTTPTCAVCHASLIVNPNNEVIAERTHKYNDRSSWRLFGVPYASTHPKMSDLSVVKNSSGLPLITELDGTVVEEFVITKGEQEERVNKIKLICNSCHSTDWTENHFTRLENTIEKTNQITYEATKILIELWKEGVAEGLPQNKNIFDEEAERIWTDIWLFHANSTRFASAMGGGGDYGVFANGRYQTSENLFKLMSLLKNSKKK